MSEEKGEQKIINLIKELSDEIKSIKENCLNDEKKISSIDFSLKNISDVTDKLVNNQKKVVKVHNEIIKDGRLEYYIDLPNVNDNKIKKIDIQRGIIGESSFSNSNVEEVDVKNLKKIEPRAFSDCESLIYFLSSDNNKPDSTSPMSDGEDDMKLTIEEESFINCSELKTVIFSAGEKIIIEKDVFKGCSSLRTVKADFKNAYICGNPFEDCPEFLTFICKEDSDIERFAIRHGYRVVYEK